MRNVLITTDEVVFHAPTKQTIDPRTIQQAIILAEERFVRPMLGDEFYDSICGEKNIVVTSGNKTSLESSINGSLSSGETVTLNVGDIVNALEFLDGDYTELWKKYLWKFIAEGVLLMATPDSFVQFGSAGVVHGAPQSGMMASGEVTPDIKAVKWLMDKKMMDRIEPMREAMHGFLCKNAIRYQFYTKDCGCNVDGVAYKRKSDIIMGLYDDLDGPARQPETRIRTVYVHQNPLAELVSTMLDVAEDGQTSFTLPAVPASYSKTLLFVNGDKRIFGRDYNIIGTELTWIDEDYPLGTTDEVEFYY